ncbi:unnamed protein product, partial [Discosporangium mesarthrocarpum]
MPSRFHLRRFLRRFWVRRGGGIRWWSRTRGSSRWRPSWTTIFKVGVAVLLVAMMAFLLVVMVYIRDPRSDDTFRSIQHMALGSPTRETLLTWEDISHILDPKARVFVDPSQQPRWGAEARKGRSKRELFMKVRELSRAGRGEQKQ